MAVGRLQRSYFTSHASLLGQPSRGLQNAEPVSPISSSSSSSSFSFSSTFSFAYCTSISTFFLARSRDGGDTTPSIQGRVQDRWMGKFDREKLRRSAINQSSRCRRSFTFLSPISARLLWERVKRARETNRERERRRRRQEERGEGKGEGRREGEKRWQTVGARIRQLRHGNVTDDRRERPASRRLECANVILLNAFRSARVRELSIALERAGEPYRLSLSLSLSFSLLYPLPSLVSSLSLSLVHRCWKLPGHLSAAGKCRSNSSTSAELIGQVCHEFLRKISRDPRVCHPLLSSFVRLFVHREREIRPFLWFLVRWTKSEKVD